MTECQRHAWWAILLADLKSKGLQRDPPGVLLAGSDVISSNDPSRTRVVNADFVKYKNVSSYIEQISKP